MICPGARTEDPYAIMVSEFMLQQTTVTAVIPYFERWMEGFPRCDPRGSRGTGSALALAGTWLLQPRAEFAPGGPGRSWKLHGGRVPRSVDALRSLPGVGDYTAAAVAAFAFDAVEPVIDANIARVLARLQDLAKAHRRCSGKAFPRAGCPRLLPESGGRLHTSALHGIGRTDLHFPHSALPGLSGAGRSAWPVSPESLPVKRPRKEIDERHGGAGFCLSVAEKLWLEPSTGPRWRGMWVLPVSGLPRDGRRIMSRSHPITRYRVTLERFCREGRSPLADRLFSRRTSRPCLPPSTGGCSDARESVILCDIYASLLSTVPDAHGHFGPYGGKFVPETLFSALEELEREYEKAQARILNFARNFPGCSPIMCGRATPLYFRRSA